MKKKVSEVFLSEILQEEKFGSFVRIHRSYAVQKQFIQKIAAQEVELHNQITLPIGRSFKENLNLFL